MLFIPDILILNNAANVVFVIIQDLIILKARLSSVLSLKSRGLSKIRVDGPKSIFNNGLVENEK